MRRLLRDNALTLAMVALFIPALVGRINYSGELGYELWVAPEYQRALFDRLMAAGEEHGIRLFGFRALMSLRLEKSYGTWYREYRPIYTLHEAGLQRYVKLDHEFIGRAALEKLAKKPKRQKVTLVWNGDDVDKVFSRLFHAGKFSKYIDLPLANYSTLPFDKIVKNGKTVGVSTYTGYSFNERAMLSLACIDVKHAKPGTKVSVVWGEDGGGTKKPTVERHKQTEIRAIVSPVPYSEVARTSYAEGWRTKSPA